MHYILIILFFLSSCGQPSQNQLKQKIVINEHPKTEVEIQNITYDESISDIVLVGENNLSNTMYLEIPAGIEYTVNLRILSKNTSGQVKTIYGNQELAAKSCIKNYVQDESCIFPVVISATQTRNRTIRIATDKGIRFFLISIKRVDPSLFPNMVVESSSIPNQVIAGKFYSGVVNLRNNGEDIAKNVSVALEGLDKNSFRIVSNSCLSVKQKSRCSIRFVFDTTKITNGVFKTNIKIQAQNYANIDYKRDVAIQSENTNSTIVNNPPIIQSIPSLLAPVGENTLFQVNSSDAENNNLYYSVESKWTDFYLANS